MAAEAEDFVVNVGEVFSNTGTEWGAMLSVGDVDNIRQFVGSFVRGALVPHVERQVRCVDYYWPALCYVKVAKQLLLHC